MQTPALNACQHWFPQYSYGDNANLADKPEHWRKLAEGVEGEEGLTEVCHLTLENITACRSNSQLFSRAFFIEGYPDRPVRALTLQSMSIDACEFGKISGVDGLCFNHVLVTAAAVTEDKNDDYSR